MTVLVALALICFTFAVVKIYAGQGQQMRQTVDKLIRDQLILRLFTVLIIALVTAVLALSGALTEGAVALLGSIAGYVLGGIPRRPSDSDNNTS